MKKAILVFVGVFLLSGCQSQIAQTPSSPQSSSESKIVQVVAAENFYGDIAKQLGGDHVAVTSILSDPNVDPHEYESNVQDAIVISKADVVIENGLDYDTWIDKLLAASPNTDRVLIVAGQISPHKLEDNPHVWYGVDNMSTIAQSITDALKKDDPADATTFDQNLTKFTNSLQPIQQKMADVKSNYAGTSVGLTETIYLYQTAPMGLNVITPLNFEKAVAEGNDPSVADVRTTNAQVTGKQIAILIYNSQTVTPITSNLQKTAQQLNIPIVAVTETMPKNVTYQSWMMAQLTAVQTALQNVPEK